MMDLPVSEVKRYLTELIIPTDTGLNTYTRLENDINILLFLSDNIDIILNKTYLENIKYLRCKLNDAGLYPGFSYCRIIGMIPYSNSMISLQDMNRVRILYEYLELDIDIMIFSKDSIYNNYKNISDIKFNYYITSDKSIDVSQCPYQILDIKEIYDR